ncbi:hypothetical protein [Micromonospora halophytica]|uniref:Uncharacterized protein n=1 Tax=Micromonospora halophytica TaxID=47864 RepID=A0A1C5HF06_9ACTN|nr:hypothetical protein [Micromonospora halophytica]SCG44437.1 hypothetical protein GA0070560_10447 [Micromonospora halophytica]
MRREEQQVSQDHPEAVRSAPVPVPPPGIAPANGTPRPGRDDRADIPEDRIEDRGTFDDPRMAGGRPADDLDDTRPYDVRELDGADTAGRPDFHEPAPLPTAFGAATVGDAVAASALASGRPEDERDARREDTAMPGDGAPGRTEPFDDERADPTAADRIHDPHRWDAAHEGASGRRDGDAPAAGAAGYGSAGPTMVDPDTEAPEGGPTSAGAGAAGAAGATSPAGANVPTHAATLFEAEAAQGFRDRWREVQLRFVDDPRAAVGEAQSLVEEAIQALSAALTAQKRQLGSWQDAGSADTEQLRVAVRQYRDFLDRVLGR